MTYKTFSPHGPGGDGLLQPCKFLWKTFAAQPNRRMYFTALQKNLANFFKYLTSYRHHPSISPTGDNILQAYKRLQQTLP